MSLVVAACNHKAARYAVEHWHYSRTLPVPPRVTYGAWEDGRFVGAVIFGRGASSHLGAMFSLDAVEVAELVRVALRDHSAPVSQIVTRAVTLLRASSPGLRLLVSFADPMYGHHGGIYQAMNWTYTGTTMPAKVYRTPDGRLLHSRVVSERGVNTQFGARRRVPKPSQLEVIRAPGKHRYVLPLDRAMKRKVAKRAQPYPSGVVQLGSTPAS